MFGNAIVPDAGTHDMKGLHLLLDLFSNPDRAKAAQELLAKVSAEKDEAVAKLEESKQALAAAVEKNAQAEQRKTDLDTREAELKKREAEAARVKTEYEERMSTMQSWLKRG